MDSSTIVLCNVLGIVSDLGALPHSGQVGRVLLAAGQGKGCNAAADLLESCVSVRAIALTLTP